MPGDASAAAFAFGPEIAEAVALTLRLAAVTTVILLLIGAPLGFWLARGRGWGREVIGALVSLPIVLPPTVLGFYLLVAMGPHSPLTALVGPLAFSFEGLVLGSVIYSLPFTVTPIRNAFAAMGDRPWEAAASLRASPISNCARTISSRLSATRARW